MPKVAISLGSNINKEQNLPAAVSLLAATGNVVEVSSVYETIPAGLNDQPTFFNAAILLDTIYPPTMLKDGLLSEIELQLKRVRQADKNAPRTIDLDIIIYGNWIGSYTPGDNRPRYIPDPALLRFVHVALPVADLLPDMAHLETGERLRDIADRLLREADTGGQPVIWARSDIDLRMALALRY
ncbi:MAG: 2-amino-4-hydroxy-6-hydroxymethyldihydropteridine diphosphokinase [Chloroflexota bacterium]|jgi:2-amino-4-hydroxy-6-hydroxymethyldihydropteridine diphosphokinase